MPLEILRTGRKHMTLHERFLSGGQRALAQAITLVEMGSAEGQGLMRAVFERSGNARVYGITGAPGAGKSTLVEQLALVFKARGQRVAIVAVDPSSPFTGGALLGDRVRMGSVLADENVFMRSLANRGHLGGLSAATGDVITLLDAFGFDVILVETVGTGQAEVEIMQYAHATLVVLVPGLGDHVQAMKAGILEIADVYAINKADRDHADRTMADLQAMLDTIHMGKPGINRWPKDDSVEAVKLSRVRRPAPGPHIEERFGSASPGDLSWVPPVLKTVATEGSGIDAVVDGLVEHDAFLRESGRGQHQLRKRAEARLRQVIGIVATRMVIAEAIVNGDLERAICAISERQLDPYSAAQNLLASRNRSDSTGRG